LEKKGQSSKKSSFKSRLEVTFAKEENFDGKRADRVFGREAGAGKKMKGKIMGWTGAKDRCKAIFTGEKRYSGSNDTMGLKYLGVFAAVEGVQGGLPRCGNVTTRKSREGL